MADRATDALAEYLVSLDAGFAFSRLHVLVLKVYTYGWDLGLGLESKEKRVHEGLIERNQMVLHLVDVLGPNSSA